MHTHNPVKLITFRWINRVTSAWKCNGYYSCLDITRPCRLAARFTTTTHIYCLTHVKINLFEHKKTRSLLCRKYQTVSSNWQLVEWHSPRKPVSAGGRSICKTVESLMNCKRCRQYSIKAETLQYLQQRTTPKFWFSPFDTMNITDKQAPDIKCVYRPDQTLMC